MGMFNRPASQYVEIFRLMDGDPTVRVRAMLKKYANTWDLETTLVKNLLSDPHSTAEDIIDTLKVFAADYSSNDEFRKGLSAMDYGTQKIRRESLVAIDKVEPELDHPDIRKVKYHRYRAA